MALAIFNSIRGEKSALLMVKANPLEFSATPVYVPRSGVEYFAHKTCEELTKGDTFDIPDGYKLVDLMDIDTDTPRTTKDGVVLKTLAY